MSSIGTVPSASDEKGYKKVDYVIFDLDGLLIDSERVYTEVTNDILAQFGETMTWEIKAGIMGKPELDAATHLLSHFPHIPLTLADYIVARNVAQDVRWPTVPLLPGAARLLAHLHTHGVPIALATGSRRTKFALKTGHLQEVFAAFGRRIVCGDDWVGPTGAVAAPLRDTAGELVGGVEGRPVLAPGRGKPAPDLFLFAARELLGRDVGTAEAHEASPEDVVERARGLVFEDALPGVEAGKRAGMNVVWVPDAGLLDVKYDGPHSADEILQSLEDFVPERWGLPPYP